MHELEITKTFDMDRDALFAAWSSADALKRWFAPGTLSVPEARCDFHVGGRFRVVMEDTDGSRHIVGGEYRRIEPGRRIDFSWQWEGSDLVTEVSVDFRSAATGSELVLRHRQFPDQELCDKHDMGWRGCLEKLTVPAAA